MRTAPPTRGRSVAALALTSGLAWLAACESSGDLGRTGAASDASPAGTSAASNEAGASGPGAGAPDSSAEDDRATPPIDTASTDAGALSSEAGPDAGASACVTSGTELCEGFESGQLDKKIWQTVTNGPSPSISVDALHVHSGHHALHLAVTPGQQSAAQITESVTFPAASDAFYTRIWAYVSPAVMWPSTPPDFHTGFIIASGNNDLGHVDLAVGANLSPSSSAGPMHYLGYSIYRGPPYDEFGPRSSTPVLNEAWTCIELFESGKGGAAAVRRIWVDGTELPEQNDTFDGQAPPQFDIVSIGIWEYHPTPSLSDMWIDDVRISSQRIGCDS